MATVPHVTSGLGLRKFQADGFLLTRVYVCAPTNEARYKCWWANDKWHLPIWKSFNKATADMEKNPQELMMD